MTLTKVAKTYPDGHQAVRSFDLEIADEEFVVFVGPSGCGKSTTLRMIAGLEPITSGTLAIDDVVVNELPPKDRDIAMVFQNYALYPHMTVSENMGFALMLRRQRKTDIDKKVNAAAKLLGLEGMLDRKPKALSGGQRQRVALGRAIVRDPRCFLFDEPLSNLDARLRVEMRAEIKKLHLRLRRTTIYVTHDQEEAMTLGDRIVVMNHGVIQQAASPLEIYRRPANRFVAGFLGTPPMNFLEGALAADGPGLTLDGPGWRLPIPEWARPSLAGRCGERIVLGVRPQAVSDGPFPVAGGERYKLSGRVETVEQLGDKMDVRFSVPGETGLVAHLDADNRLHPGQTVEMYFDVERLHFFAADGDGEALAHRT